MIAIPRQVDLGLIDRLDDRDAVFNGVGFTVYGDIGHAFTLVTRSQLPETRDEDYIKVAEGDPLPGNWLLVSGFLFKMYSSNSFLNFVM